MSEDSSASVETLERESKSEGKDEKSPLLTAKDRCDRCNAQAYYLVAFSEGGLYFCWHHYNEYYPALYASKSVVDVLDDSEKLFS